MGKSIPVAKSLTADEHPHITTLPNGLTVLLEPLSHIHSATVGVWIKTGSACEAAPISGICHLIEHLLFKGTLKRSARQIMQEVESRGGHLNAFTSREHTCLYAKVLGEHIKKTIEVLADIIKNSQFYDLEKERNVVLEEIASTEDIPEEYVHDLFVSSIWPEHALGRPIAGTQDTVSAITIEDIWTHYRNTYRPENICISVAGRFDQKAVLDLISREFGDMGGSLVALASDPVIYSAGTTFVERDISQVHLCVGFPGPTATSPKRYLYDVLSNILGGGSTSRLFERIREDEGLAYSIYSFHSCYTPAGYLGVYAATAPENVDLTLELAFEELRKIRDQKVDVEEMNLNREQIKGNILMALESSYHRMSRMARMYLYYGRVLSVAEVVDAIEAVTAEAVIDESQQLFRPENCVMTLIGPPDKQKTRKIAL